MTYCIQCHYFKKVSCFEGYCKHHLNTNKNPMASGFNVYGNCPKYLSNSKYKKICARKPQTNKSYITSLHLKYAKTSRQQRITRVKKVMYNVNVLKMEVIKND